MISQTAIRAATGDAATTEAARPMLVSTAEARRQLGGIGKTCLYDMIRRHSIRCVRIGSLTRIPMAEIERVVAELMAADQPDQPAEQAKARAVKSVAARRSRRGKAA
jgi:excisionase family DNA binding protein